MVNKVKEIGKNPLKAAEMEEAEEIAKMMVEKQDGEKNKKGKKNITKKEVVLYETTILEKTIIKIGALLALGFGEAGSEIIAKNME